MWSDFVGFAFTYLARSPTLLLRSIGRIRTGQDVCIHDRVDAGHLIPGEAGHAYAAAHSWS